MADALAKATRAYFDYQSNWEVEGRDLVFVEVDFINDMSAETGDSYSTAVGGLEIARLALMNWGCTIDRKSTRLNSSHVALSRSLHDALPIFHQRHERRNR